MIEFETATTVYKSLHGLAPEYMQLMFTKLSENNSRSLRNTDTGLKIPRFATSYGQRTINAKSLGTLTVFFDLAGERSPLPLKTMLIYTGFIHSK